MKRASGETLLAALAVALLVGCAGQTKRLHPDEASDMEIGGDLTSQDFRSIAQRMARSLVTVEQIQKATSPPTVAFISVDNRSDEYLDADMFLNKMRTELVKHAQGRIIFLDRSAIDVLRKEVKDKERGKVTASDVPELYGADYFLTGTIETIEKVAGAGRTVYWRLSFRLVAGNSAVVWEDDYEIKKYTETSTYKQ